MKKTWIVKKICEAVNHPKFVWAPSKERNPWSSEARKSITKKTNELKCFLRKEHSDLSKKNFILYVAEILMFSKV